MGAYTWPQVLNPLLRREDLEASATAWAMEQILSGAASPAQLAGFVIALRSKGETVTEVEGLVATMRDFATRISVPGRTLDVVGTGGDQAHTVNISTMSAIVAAGAGAKVLKHGNRAASSACGAADVLEELGIPLDLTAAQVAEVGERAGITFCFAPAFHPALRHAAVPRRELGVPTTFNFLGPLANPAGARRQTIGVGDAAMAERMVATLVELGTERALVFFGHDGLDELTTTTTSAVWEIADGEIHFSNLDPTELGIPLAVPEDLVGGDPEANARLARAVLEGKAGPHRDIVVLNAAAALLAAGTATDFAAGIEAASESLNAGRAAAALEGLITVSREAAEAEAAG